MTELRALTGARGIAAWLVVLFHIRASIAGLPGPVARLLDKGYLAVDFFFLLSGFVIWLAWHDRLRGMRGANGVPGFLWRRIARVWPLHLAMLAAAVAIPAGLTAIGHPAPPHAYADLPFHVLLVQNWGIVPPLAWNAPAWSISAELAAYIAFPLLVLTTDWRRWPVAALPVAAAAPLALLAWIMRGEVMLGYDIARFGVVRCLTEFAAGTVVAALWLRCRGRVSAWWPAALALIALASGGPEIAVVPAGFAALLLALALGAGSPGNPLEHRWIHRLGELSYATYLSHYVLWQAFKLVAVRDVHAVPPLHIGAFLLLVLAASAALRRHVELPAKAWLERARAPRIGWRSQPEG